MKIRLGLFVVALQMAMCFSAFADSFGPVVLGITNAPCGNGTCVPTNANIATVSAVQNANLTSVTFTVKDLPGYSTQIQSNDFFDFNTNIVPLTSLALEGNSVTVFSGFGAASVSTKVNETVVGQSGTGHFSFGLDDTGGPPTINNQTVTGASEFMFTIDLIGPATVNGQTITQLLASNFYPQPNSQGYNFQMHFCDSSTPTCDKPTGFVVDTGTPTPVPEPSSMLLLGIGFGAVGLVRGKHWSRLKNRVS